MSRPHLQELPGVGEKPKADTQLAIGKSDRRSHMRFAISAEAEATDVKTRSRVSGHATDIGMHGCYIDTAEPFPVGSIIAVRLKADHRSFQATASVIYVHGGVGMGMVFTEISAEQQRTLNEWLHKLSGGMLDINLETPDLAGDGKHHESARQEDAVNEVVDELVRLLKTKDVLTDAESDSLRRNLRH